MASTPHLIETQAFVGRMELYNDGHVECFYIFENGAELSYTLSESVWRILPAFVDSMELKE